MAQGYGNVNPEMAQGFGNINSDMTRGYGNINPEMAQVLAVGTICPRYASDCCGWNLVSLPDDELREPYQHVGI
ncbi:hypothetical protein CHS0354_028943 [Potamilus streckersoni]|uniref:Uncharacterized protein n=1 Tax=Potamilus streckersoni TaxID=2493646 RepID=A0AAE0VXN2_9BIVA|nr:hypothetical protein CHS0354_028943 [Potamilus streckersoni]